MCPAGSSETSLKLCRCLIFIIEQSLVAVWVKVGSLDPALQVPGGLGCSAKPLRPQALSRAKHSVFVKEEIRF